MICPTGCEKAVAIFFSFKIQLSKTLFIFICHRHPFIFLNSTLILHRRPDFSSKESDSAIAWISGKAEKSLRCPTTGKVSANDAVNLDRHATVFANQTKPNNRCARRVIYNGPPKKFVTEICTEHKNFYDPVRWSKQQTSTMSSSVTLVSTIGSFLRRALQIGGTRLTSVHNFIRSVTTVAQSNVVGILPTYRKRNALAKFGQCSDTPSHECNWPLSACVRFIIHCSVMQKNENVCSWILIHKHIVTFAFILCYILRIYKASWINWL